ncbi:MAG: cation transporter [Acidobacteria bacterium]|nr:cation transporter [Acidobacteriota bacterium]
MIVAAALSRLIHPLPLEQAGIGLGISALAALINLAVARILLNAGRTHHLVTLEADGQHPMTDVWTSADVIASRFDLKDALHVERTGSGFSPYQGLRKFKTPYADYECANIQVFSRTSFAQRQTRP